MNVISLILLVLGLLLAVAGAVRMILVLIARIPTLALIDVRAIPVDKTQKKKEEIIADRILRKLSKNTAPVKNVFLKLGEWIRDGFRRLAKTAFDLEKHSEIVARKKWDALTVSTRMHTIMREADKLAKEERFPEAEKKYIEALSIDEKNPKLYEKLGRLYLRNKQYDQARETLRFASRLSPNDASVVAFLGEVAMAREEYADAVTYFKHAVSLRPKSPRYLDLLLDACIIGGDRAGADEALLQLNDVNPQNAKLPELAERIRKMA